jgi:phosphoserine phosphatase
MPLYVATLIADPPKTVLSDAAIARVAQGLPSFASSRWLDPGIAADVFFEDHDADSGRTRAQAFALSEAIDIIVQPARGRAKKLLIADMDSTLIGQECID